MSTRQEIIQPLDSEQQQLVIEETQAYIKLANDLFKIKNTSVDITFNLKGRAAGMYRVKRKILTQVREIRYNPFIFSKYFDDNFKTTIPHEVAHYITDQIHDLRNIKPHGKEWKKIMQVFGADAAVTAAYDLTGIPQRSKASYTYQCGCREHQVGAIRHNRIEKQGGTYICNLCNHKLHFKQPAAESVT